MRLPLYCVLAATLFLAASSPVECRGQETMPSSVTRGDYVNTYARPGQATETVYIWGAVDKPGVWKIAPKTGLVELFSVVHPSGYGLETPGRDREVVLRIHRTEGGTTRMAHEFKLTELLEMRPDERPLLQPEDVVEVRTVESRSFGLNVVGTIVGTLSSVTLLVLRIVDP